MAPKEGNNRLLVTINSISQDMGKQLPETLVLEVLVIFRI
jgi:hypothetical protein